jgi:hypothetical protein
MFGHVESDWATNLLPGSLFPVPLAFSLALKASIAAWSGVPVAKEEALSRSARSDEDFSAPVEAYLRAQRGAARRGICLRPSELAMRAPSRTVAIIRVVGYWNWSSTKRCEVVAWIWKFPSKRLAPCCATCGWCRKSWLWTSSMFSDQITNNLQRQKLSNSPETQ